MNTINQLQKIKELLESGAIDQNEFQKLKDEILNPTQTKYNSEKKNNYKPSLKNKSKYFIYISSAILVLTLIFIAYFLFKKDTVLVPYLKENGKYVYFDSKSMKQVLQDEYDDAQLFSEGLAAVRKGVMCGFINEKGEMAIPFKYKSVSNFKNGLAEINSSEGLYQHYIDKSGNEVNIKVNGFNNIDFNKGYFLLAQHLSDWSDGYHSYEKNRFKILNIDGKTITQTDYDYATNFNEGLALVGNGIYIDTPFRPQGMMSFHGKMGFIDTTGKQVTAFNFEDGRNFSEGLAAVKMNGKFGFINKSSEMVIPYQFDDVQSFSEGLAVVINISPSTRFDGNESSYGFINTDGKLIIDYKFSFASDFHDGLALVYIDDKMSFINKVGEVISKKYDYAKDFQDGMAVVANGVRLERTGQPAPGGKYGFINNKGEEIISLKYSFVCNDYENDFARVGIDNLDKSFYVDKEGNEFRFK